MLMPIGGAHGHLQLSLRAAAAGQPSQLIVQRQEPPLRVVRAFAAADGTAVVHLHNLSGGVLGGIVCASRQRLTPAPVPNSLLRALLASIASAPVCPKPCRPHGCACKKAAYWNICPTC